MSIGTTSNMEWLAGPSSGVTDVLQNGTSVVDNGVARVTVPTKTSDIQNDSGFITSAQVPTYSSGNMVSINGQNQIGVNTTAGITDIQLVNSLPANPVATVLYLIPET